ncbi:MAG: transglutaminase domain-containing protein [Chloroflexi bacterium]|nr:transglutaminase domain-containing protein [Chloroflexota bacterium]
MLAGVDGAGSRALFSTPSQTMAFGGSLTLTDEPLMWVRSRYVVPYAGRVYQQYSSEGWLTGASTKVKAPPRSALTLAPTELERERVSQVYIPLVDIKTVVPAGGVFSVDRESTVQVLNPLLWQVPLFGSVAQISRLPADLRDLSFAIRFALNDLVPVSTFQPTQLNNQNLTHSEVVEEVLLALQAADLTGEDQVLTRTVVDDLGVEEKFETIVIPLSKNSRSVDWGQLKVTIGTDSETGMANRLNFERSSPIEQIGVELSREISKDETFSIQTFVSLATDDQLNEAGLEYPTWIGDRYLQLPPSLPDEVGILASQIIRDADAVTPFEKTEAVKAFLRNQEYSLEIMGPEFGVDGIYYFLFQTQDEPCASIDPNCDTSKIKGYSQYFGSSAAVLLRSVGVPARFVAGWASGEYVPSAGMFLVRDKDRHGWTQVYFPEYGWIDYEVTPGRASVERGNLSPSLTGGDRLTAGAVSSSEDDLDFLLDIADLERLAREARALAGELPVRDDTQSNQDVFPWEPFVWAGGVVAAIGVAMFVWWFSLRGLDASAKAYARVGRIAFLLGMKRRNNQTALEFVSDLGDQTVAAREHAIFIAIEFQRQVYAGLSNKADVDHEQSKNLDKAWRRVARALIIYRIRQLSGIGPEFGEGRRVKW